MAAAGMSWYCPQDRMHRKVSANDVLEGMMIYSFSDAEKRSSRPVKTRTIKVHEYGVDSENGDGGASVVVDVPSRTQDSKYRVKLHHFPFIGSHDVWVWMQLLSEHSDCGSKDFGDVYWQRDKETGKRRKLRDVVFCPHDVAAYLAVSAEESRRVHSMYKNPSRVLTVQPFPLFTMETVKFWNKLRTQTFFGHPGSARPLRECELEIELERFLFRKDPKETMYKKLNSEKLRDYPWKASFPVRE